MRSAPASAIGARECILIGAQPLIDALAHALPGFGQIEASGNHVIALENAHDLLGELPRGGGD